MKKAILALAATAVTGTAVAGPSWTYVDLGYLRSSSISNDIDGYEVAGSIGFADMWHAQASYGTQEVDGGGVEIDKYYSVNVGVHPAITDNTDFVADVGYTKWDIENGNSPKVYTLGLGVRSMLTEKMELSALLTTQSGDLDAGANDDLTNIVPELGGQYFFTDNVSVNVAYAWGNTEGVVLGTGNQAKFGVRWSF